MDTDQVEWSREKLSQASDEKLKTITQVMRSDGRTKVTFTPASKETLTLLIDEFLS